MIHHKFDIYMKPGKRSVKVDFHHYIYPITFAAKYNQIKIVVKWKHVSSQKMAID